MSRMKPAAKPPLPKSPIRLRSRSVLRSNPTPLQTPPGSMKKSAQPSRLNNVDESDLRPEYRSISTELDALTQMIHNEIGKMASNKSASATGFSANSPAFFERGRLYDVYSARRNERLKRKKYENVESAMKTPYCLGVTVESSKKMDSKKLESLKKSVSVAYSVDRTQNSRYMLRSLSKDKENKRPELTSKIPTPSFSTAKKPSARRVRKI